jgi:hypothetical protein
MSSDAVTVRVYRPSDQRPGHPERLQSQANTALWRLRAHFGQPAREVSAVVSDALGQATDGGQVEPADLPEATDAIRRGSYLTVTVTDRYGPGDDTAVRRGTVPRDDVLAPGSWRGR